jgi:peptide/nickel transport system substrate-binding protein
VYAQGIDRVEKVNSHTIDIFSDVPNPVLVNQLTELRILSKAWAEKNKSVEPKDIKNKDETFAHRNALGTGPYVLKSWTPDQRVVLEPNPHWWGKGKFATNVTEVVYTPIKSDATRTAALLSGEIDFIIDPSLQDLARMRQTPGPEGAGRRRIPHHLLWAWTSSATNCRARTSRARTRSRIVRVRKALYQAIDINSHPARGAARPGPAHGHAGCPPGQRLDPKADVRYPFDAKAAQKLLADAGYPQGFEVDFACSAGRYINDEQLCQAITAQWAKVGVKAKLRSLPFATYFPMIQRNEASIYLLGWGVPTFDAFYSLQSLIRSPGAGGDGNFNLGRFSNPQQDALIERIKKETDLPVRNRLLTEGLQLSNDTVSHIPLHNQVIPWAMKKNVDVPLFCGA